MDTSDVMGYFDEGAVEEVSSNSPQARAAPETDDERLLRLLEVAEAEREALKRGNVPHRMHRVFAACGL